MWSWVGEARTDLAGRLGSLGTEDWDAPSLCEGWRVRDVVGHLVWLAEATGTSALRDALRQAPRPVGAAMVRIGRQVGGSEPATLVERLGAAADGRFVMPTLGPLAALGEVYVHGSDALRAVGQPGRPADARTGLVAERYRGLGIAFGARSASKVRFTATDAGWSVGPDDGPPASGPGEAVLLALAGRPAGVADLTGAGVDRLR